MMMHYSEERSKVSYYSKVSEEVWVKDSTRSLNIKGRINYAYLQDKFVMKVLCNLNLGFFSFIINDLGIIQFSFILIQIKNINLV